MRRGGNRALKTAGFLFGTLPGFLLSVLIVLVLLLIVGFNILFNTSVLDKVALKALAGMVDGEVKFSDVELDLVKDFPVVSLSADSLLITYPHDTYPLASELDEGRGEEMDTLLSAARLRARFNVNSFLKGHNFIADSVLLDSPRAFIRVYPDSLKNLYVIKSMRPKDKKSSFQLGDISIGSLDISSPRVVYSDSLSGKIATLDWQGMQGGGSFYKGEETCEIDALVSFEGLNLGELVSTLGRSIVPSLGALGTDAIVSLDLTTKGKIRPDSLSKLPPATLRLSVPESNWSWKGVLQDAGMSFVAVLENSESNVKDLKIEELLMKMDGVNLKASADVADLLGGDPAIKIDARGRAVLQKARQHLPRSLRSRIRASGAVNLKLDGTARPSQLRLDRIAKADLSAHLDGGEVKFAMSGSDLDLYMLRPVVNLNTMNSSVAKKDRAIALTSTADSVGFDLGEDLCLKGRKVLVFAQNSARAIADSSMWHPLLGKISAESLVLRTDDSLVTGMRRTENKFTVTSISRGGKDVPYLKLDNKSGSLFFRNSSAMVGAFNASVTASARMNVETDTMRRARLRRSVSSLDSIAIPDYLKEKDFRTSDIRFKTLGGSIGKFLKSWNPAMDISADAGFLASPAFPLRTRFTGLDAYLKDDKIVIDSLHLVSGTSDLSLYGSVEGLKRGLTRGRSMIRFDAEIEAGRLNIDEILAALDKGKGEKVVAQEGEDIGSIDAEGYEESVVQDSIATDGSGRSYSLFVIPANLKADICAAADRIDVAGIEFDDFHSDMLIRQRCVSLQDAHASTAMGKFALDAFYSTVAKDNLNAGFDLKLSEVTAADVIALFPGVGKTIPMLGSFKGLLDCEMSATSQLDTNMNILPPTLNGMFKIHGKDLVLENLESIRKVTKLLMFKDKTSGRVDSMSVNGIVSDNSLEIFPFILDIDRYTVALQGVQSLSGGFDYHASFIRSPLPFKVGVNFFGPSFKEWRFRIGSPKYRSVKLPLYTNELDDMQLNLVTSIKEVLSRGVDRVMQDSRDVQANVSRRKEELGESSSELLTPQEQYELESALIEREVEEETAALSEEIDRLIGELL